MSARKGGRRSTAFHKPGELGRKTGVRVPENISKDATGMDDVESYFVTRKSPRRVSHQAPTPVQAPASPPVDSPLMPVSGLASGPVSRTARLSDKRSGKSSKKSKGTATRLEFGDDAHDDADDDAHDAARLKRHASSGKDRHTKANRASSGAAARRGGPLALTDSDDSGDDDKRDSDTNPFAKPSRDLAAKLDKREERERKKRRRQRVVDMWHSEVPAEEDAQLPAKKRKTDRTMASSSNLGSSFRVHDDALFSLPRHSAGPAQPAFYNATTTVRPRVRRPIAHHAPPPPPPPAIPVHPYAPYYAPHPYAHAAYYPPASRAPVYDDVLTRQPPSALPAHPHHAPEHFREASARSLVTDQNDVPVQLICPGALTHHQEEWRLLDKMSRGTGRVFVGLETNEGIKQTTLELSPHAGRPFLRLNKKRMTGYVLHGYLSLEIQLDSSDVTVRQQLAANASFYIPYGASYKLENVGSGTARVVFWAFSVPETYDD